MPSISPVDQVSGMGDDDHGGQPSRGKPRCVYGSQPILCEEVEMYLHEIAMDSFVIVQADWPAEKARQAILEKKQAETKKSAKVSL